jgi:hypothetical protein
VKSSSAQRPFGYRLLPCTGFFLSVPQINIETLLTANRDEIDLDLIREE